MNTKNLLLIEDDQMIGEIIVDSFKYIGVETTWVMSPQEGLEKLKSDLPFDLVITDNSTPNGQVIDFITEIRALAKCPLVMSSGDTHEVERRFLEAGGDRFFRKIDGTAMMAFCRDLLKGKFI